MLKTDYPSVSRVKPLKLTRKTRWKLSPNRYASMRRWRSLRLVYFKCGRDAFYKMIRRHPKKRNEEAFSELSRIAKSTQVGKSVKYGRVKRRVRSRLVFHRQSFITTCRYRDYGEEVFSERNDEFSEQIPALGRKASGVARTAARLNRSRPRRLLTRRRLSLVLKRSRLVSLGRSVRRYNYLSMLGVRRGLRRNFFARSLTSTPWYPSVGGLSPVSDRRPKPHIEGQPKVYRDMIYPWRTPIDAHRRVVSTWSRSYRRLLRYRRYIRARNPYTRDRRRLGAVRGVVFRRFPNLIRGLAGESEVCFFFWTKRSGGFVNSTSSLIKPSATPRVFLSSNSYSPIFETASRLALVKQLSPLPLVRTASPSLTGYFSQSRLQLLVGYGFSEYVCRTGGELVDSHPDLGGEDSSSDSLVSGERFLFHNTLSKVSVLPHPGARVGFYSRRVSHALMRAVWGSRWSSIREVKVNRRDYFGYGIFRIDGKTKRSSRALVALPKSRELFASPLLALGSQTLDHFLENTRLYSDVSSMSLSRSARQVLANLSARVYSSWERARSEVLDTFSGYGFTEFPKVVYRRKFVRSRQAKWFLRRRLSRRARRASLVASSLASRAKLAISALSFYLEPRFQPSEVVSLSPYTPINVGSTRTPLLRLSTWSAAMQSPVFMRYLLNPGLDTSYPTLRSSSRLLFRAVSNIAHVSFDSRVALLRHSNIIPADVFKFSIRRRILKVVDYNKFVPNVTSWYYQSLIRFIEQTSGKKAYLRFNPSVAGSITYADAARSQLWAGRIQTWQRLMGPKFYLGESLQLLHLTMRYKDPTLLSAWMRGMMSRLGFWNHRLLYRYLQYVLRYLFYLEFPELKIRGLKFRLKGKIGVAGNARSRSLVVRIGSTSHARLDNRVLHDFSLVNTFTGVMGLQVWMYY